MIRFIFAVFFALLTVYNLAQAGESFDLRGSWMRTNAQEGERAIQFIAIGETFRAQTQERFVYQNGRLSHTIDQSVKIFKSQGNELHGVVDFYDSRGCTFKGLDVLVDIQNYYVVNVLMTVPRYQVIRGQCNVLEYVESAVQLYRL